MNSSYGRDTAHGARNANNQDAFRLCSSGAGNAMHPMNPYGAMNPYHDQDSWGCIPYEGDVLSFGQRRLFRRIGTE